MPTERIKIRPDVKVAAVRYVHQLFMHAGDSSLIRVLKKEAFKRVYKEILHDPNFGRPRAMPHSYEPWNREKPSGFEDFLKGSISLPSLPHVQIQLRKIINSPDHDAADLIKVISNDPKLSVAVMRLANSGLYQIDEAVDTPAKAVKTLGFSKAGSLALGTVSLSLFKRQKTYVLDLEEFWTHCIACGVIAQEIAFSAKLGDPERFFTGGLIHDFGLHVIFESNPGLAVELYRLSNREGYNLCKAEQELLGFSHTDLGGYILEKWKFPRQLVSAAGGHHNPCMIKTDPDAMVIHVADFIAQALGYGLGLSKSIGVIDPKAWEIIGITEDQLIEMLPEIRRLVKDIVNILEE
jgi:HD-like signal output (HDOD) protein